MKDLGITALKFVITFSLGVGIGYLLFQEKVWDTILVLSMRVCNEMDTLIDETTIVGGPTFFDVESGKCSKYSSSGILYFHLALSLRIGGHKHQEVYTYTPLDVMGTSYLRPGEYTSQI